MCLGIYLSIANQLMTPQGVWIAYACLLFVVKIDILTTRSFKYLLRETN